MKYIYEIFMTHKDEFYKNSSEKRNVEMDDLRRLKDLNLINSLKFRIKKLKVLKNHLEVKKRM